MNLAQDRLFGWYLDERTVRVGDGPRTGSPSERRWAVDVSTVGGLGLAPVAEPLCDQAPV